MMRLLSLRPLITPVTVRHASHLPISPALLEPAARAVRRTPEISRRLVQPRSPRSPRYSRIRIAEQDDVPQLFDLIVDYMRHPEHAASVKEFVFRLPGHYYTESSGYPTVLAEGEGEHDTITKALLSQAVSRVAFDGQEHEQDLRVLLGNNHGPQFATLATSILLTLCPNVETLTFGDENPFVTDLLRRNNFGMLPGKYLQNLKDVHLLPPNASGCSYVANDLLKLVQCFHRLPSIDSISTDAVEPDLDGQSLEILPPGTSNSTKLRIGHTTYGSHEVSALIRVPKALEEFTYTSGGKWSMSHDYNLCNKKDIAKALLCHKDTLRTLDLDIDEYACGGDSAAQPESAVDDWDLTLQNLDRDVYFQEDQSIMKGPLVVRDLPDDRTYSNSFGSLHDFESLTHLSIGIETLLGRKSMHSEWSFPWFQKTTKWLPETPFRLVDALPPNLQYLQIRGYERGQQPEWDAQFDELMALKAERLPSLHEIHGVSELIPSAKTIRIADATMDDMWVYNEKNDGWKVDTTPLPAPKPTASRDGLVHRGAWLPQRPAVVVPDIFQRPQAPLYTPDMAPARPDRQQ